MFCPALGLDNLFLDWCEKGGFGVALKKGDKPGAPLVKFIIPIQKKTSLRLPWPVA